jgi:hypothetical protein
MATGSLMIYGPASILLWFELDNQNKNNEANTKLLRHVCWSLIGIGIACLILKNIYNIYSYLA